MLLFVTTVVKTTTNGNSFWDFPPYTQVGMAGQWCQNFPEVMECFVPWSQQY